MSQHAARPAGRGRSLVGVPAWATTVLAGAAVVGALGVVLGIAAWAAPVAGPAKGTPDAGQTMRFTYSADVPRSPAYDDTTVTAPQPVFRRLAEDVEVGFEYAGPPGTVTVEAVLSTASGWHSTVRLAEPRSFTQDAYTGTVRLDLPSLEERAESAAVATGIPAGQVDVSVVPTVETSGREPFAPALDLALNPLQLTLATEDSPLEASVGTADAEDPSGVPTVGLAGRELPVPTARVLSVVMTSGALLTALVLGLLARISAPSTEAAAIRRRHSQRLVEVQPMPAPPGRPVVDVVDFAALVRLAERYEMLIMHWSRSGVDTFAIQDQGTTYRYRTGNGVTDARPDAAHATV